MPDGRVSLSLVADQVEIKYQHLNPATYFQEVVEVARSVVLAGGTMSPVSTSPSPPGCDGYSLSATQDIRRHNTTVSVRLAGKDDDFLVWAYRTRK